MEMHSVAVVAADAIKQFVARWLFLFLFTVPPRAHFLFSFGRWNDRPHDTKSDGLASLFLPLTLSLAHFLPPSRPPLLPAALLALRDCR